MTSDEFERLLLVLHSIDESLKDIANVKRKLYLLKVEPPRRKQMRGYDFSAKTEPAKPTGKKHEK
jgi:hypothetical protein